MNPTLQHRYDTVKQILRQTCRLPQIDTEGWCAAPAGDDAEARDEMRLAEPQSQRARVSCRVRLLLLRRTGQVEAQAKVVEQAGPLEEAQESAGSRKRIFQAIARSAAGHHW